MRAFTSPASTTLAGGQVLLGGGPIVFGLPLRAAPATWSATIPIDASLAGFEVYTQAAHLFGVTPYALSNSRDLVIGY